MKVNEAYRDIDLPVDNWPLRRRLRGAAVVPGPERLLRQQPDAVHAADREPADQPERGRCSTCSTPTRRCSTVCRYDGYDPTTLPLRQQGRQTVGYRFVLGLVSLSAARALQPAHRRSADQLGVGARADVRRRGPHVRGARHRRAAGRGEAAEGRHDGRAPGPSTTRALSTAEGGAPTPARCRSTRSCRPRASTRRRRPSSPSSSATRAATARSRAWPTASCPPGYLPLTADNGLGAQRDYLLTAVAAVRTQAGDVPALDIDGARSATTACDFTQAEAVGLAVAEPRAPTPTAGRRRACRPRRRRSPDAPGAGSRTGAARRRGAAGRRGDDGAHRPGRRRRSAGSGSPACCSSRSPPRWPVP